MELFLDHDGLVGHLFFGGAVNREKQYRRHNDNDRAYYEYSFNHQQLSYLKSVIFFKS